MKISRASARPLTPAPWEGAAVVGVVKGNRFIEVKAIDKTQKVDELSAKLKAVMKSVAARL